MDKMHDRHRNNQEGIAYTLLKFSLPLIFSGILQQLYNWADAFIVGNVEGELALAAIGATGTVVNFYLMAITGFTLGLSILFAHKSGSGENKAIPEILSSFSLLFGVGFFAFAVLGIWLAYPILRLLHTTGDTIRLAGDYLRIIFAGIPFLAVYNVYSAALRGIGDSRAPFLAILFSSAVNVVRGLSALGCQRRCCGNGYLPGSHDGIPDSVRGCQTPPAAVLPGWKASVWERPGTGVPIGYTAHDPIQCQRIRQPAPAEFHEWFWDPNSGGHNHCVPGRYNHPAANH